MSLSPGAQEFITRVSALPAGAGASQLIDNALAPSLAEEAELRRLFATDRKNPKLADQFVGLVDVFNAPSDIKITRSRVVKDDEDRAAKFVLPLSEPREETEEQRLERIKNRYRSTDDIAEDDDDDDESLNPGLWKLRRKEGAPCMVDSLEEFQKNWSIFSEGSLSQLIDWNNVVAAGGSVLACVTPIPGKLGKTRRGMRKYYHHNAFPTSDVDLFLYGLTPEEAEKKIVKIHQAVRDSIPWETTCIRTKHAISIHSQYPYRPVQIVLRLYQSPAEILAGFDIDAPCVLYNGSSVFANPRAIAAMMRQCNMIDVTRRSPSYEVRLVKYASRGFEVYIPDLKREEIDPTIFERAITRIEGLARLLVLEKLNDSDRRENYLNSRRSLRSRPSSNRGSNRYYRRRNKYKGDLKGDQEDMLTASSNYDPGTLQIPYGPGWNAKRVATLVYKSDLGMNSTFNPKNKGIRLHRHQAFFGSAEECMADCCEKCPAPVTEEEKTLHEDYSKSYIEGRITFIQEDPGRQSMTGSFNPIDTGEWSAQAYLGATEKFFTAIAKHDRATVQSMLAENSVDVHRRDHVGRTALQLAIMVKASDICRDLIDAGSRVSARVVDGRNCLHLAAQNGLRSVVEALVAKSKENEAERDRIKAEKERLEKEKESIGEESEMEVDESEDDWNSDSDSDDGLRRGKRKVVIAVGDKKEVHDTADLPEDNTTEPDILNINEMDWDLNYAPLAFAIVSGSYDCVDALLNAGAEVELKLTTKSGVTYSAPAAVQYLILSCKMLPSAPIFTSSVSDTELFERQVTVPIFNRLIQGGATTSQADERLFSTFHALVAAGEVQLVIQALSFDPNARVAMNTPTKTGRSYSNAEWLYPLVTAVTNEDFAMVLALLAFGVKSEFRAEDIDRAKQVIRSMIKSGSGDSSSFKIQDIPQPVEVALSHRSPLIHLLAGAGVQVSATCRNSLENDLTKPRFSLVDWVHEAVEVLTTTMKEERELREKEKAKKKEPVKATAPDYCEFPQDAGTTWEQARFYQQKLLADLRKKRKEEEAKKNGTSSSKPPGLFGVASDSERAAKDAERAAEERERDLNASIEYFKQAEAVLRENGAKTWNELYPNFDKPLPSVTPPEPVTPLVSVPVVTTPTETPKPEKFPRRAKYTLKLNRWSSSNVPDHQLDAYDALFEACYAGDNAKIRELCMPQPPSAPEQGSKAPLQISVNLSAYNYDDKIEEFTYGDGVYSPLGAAILARRWDTARVILDIVKEQHKKPEVKKPAMEFNTKSIRLTEEDEDDDEDSDEDDSDDMTECGDDKPLFQTANIAEPVPMAVQCLAEPFDMLNSPAGTRVGRDGKTEISSGSPLQQAVREGDLEAFKVIYDLYTSFEDDENQTGAFITSSQILNQDDPEILDEYIRRTGWGIELPALPEEEIKRRREEEESKLYLGLNVNGKKRKDLATQGNLGYRDSNPGTPPLWQASAIGSKKIMEYFNTPKPLEAYKHFASNEDTELAKFIRGMVESGELDKKMPVLMGVEASPGANLDEEEGSMKSVLTYTLGSGGSRDDILELLKLLLSLYPGEVQNALNSRNFKNHYSGDLLYKFVNLFEPKVVNHLLSNGFSVEGVDSKGWNILHTACSASKVVAYDWFSSKLPKETISRMLLQRSKEQLNTPLMVAVKSAKVTFVKKFLSVDDREAVRASLLLRDANGFLPLHVAVRKGYAKIAKLLLDQEDYPAEMLHAENGVGETPLDTATTLWLLDATSNASAKPPSSVPSLDVGVLNTYNKVTTLRKISPGTGVRYSAATLQEELESVQKVIRELEGRVRISSNPRLKFAVDKFVGALETMIAYVKEREAQKEADRKEREKNAEPKKPKDPNAIESDSANRTKMVEVIAGAIVEKPAQRQLVHVADVQISVKSSLERKSYYYNYSQDPQF